MLWNLCKTAETGIWMDIFPVDTIRIKNDISKERPIIDKAVSEYVDFYKKETILNS